MNKFRLLVLEDETDDLDDCQTIIERYKEEKGRHFKLIPCSSQKEALKKLDKSLDGAIIDLTLYERDDEGNQIVEENDAGNQIVQKIAKSFFRIPIAILTQDKSNWDSRLNEEIMLVGVFSKSKTGYEEILDKFWEIYNTGLTHIMGGRGKIETTLNQVFLENLKPNRQSWISYANEGENEEDRRESVKRTQNALLRYTLNHLLQLLDENEEHCFPEEFYLHPPASEEITTGSIVKEKTSDQPFVVLNPACDLVPRGENGLLNTDYILLVEIERVDEVLEGSKSKSKVTELCRNKRNHYHWLPETHFFDGGILNFRKLRTLNEECFEEKFGKPVIQISPSFVKDIVSRFSSYYARQGQPDIDSKDFITRYTT